MLDLDEEHSFIKEIVAKKKDAKCNKIYYIYIYLFMD